LKRGQGDAIGPVLDRNFDIRRRVCCVSDGNIRMVEMARSVGASAKFTGSGGAIVGTYTDEKMYRALEESLQSIDVRVLRPTIENESSGRKGGVS